MDAPKNSKRITAAQAKLIIRLHHQGVSDNAIARQTGRSVHAVKIVIAEPSNYLVRQRVTCPTCGGWIVVLPCLLCKARVGSIAELCDGEGPQPGDPAPDEIEAAAHALRKPPRLRDKPREKPEPTVDEYWSSDIVSEEM